MARGPIVAALAVALTASDARACECYVQATTLGASPATGTSATDAAGNRSAARRLLFTVVAGR